MARTPDPKVRRMLVESIRALRPHGLLLGFDPDDDAQIDDIHLRLGWDDEQLLELGPEYTDRALLEADGTSVFWGMEYRAEAGDLTAAIESCMRVAGPALPIENLVEEEVDDGYRVTYTVAGETMEQDALGKYWDIFHVNQALRGSSRRFFRAPTEMGGCLLFLEPDSARQLENERGWDVWPPPEEAAPAKRRRFFSGRR